MLNRCLLWAVIVASLLLGMISLQRLIVLHAQPERPLLTRLECEATSSNLACLAFLSGSVMSIETTITVRDRSGQSTTRTITTVPQ